MIVLTGNVNRNVNVVLPRTSALSETRIAAYLQILNFIVRFNFHDST
jgi:hypothetical protein